VPRGWREGDAIVSASADGLTAEAALIRFVARVAPLLSLAHDDGDGGAKAALAEAALWSGIGAEAEVPEDARVLLACPPERVGRLGAEFVQIGVAGGTTLLGQSLDEIRTQWETNH
jgi:phosphoribosylformylglycinamidine (FGAM) synthase-like enzyme